MIFYTRRCIFLIVNQFSVALCAVHKLNPAVNNSSRVENLLTKKYWLMWVKSQPYWNQKHELLEFCGNRDFTLYSSCFITINGFGWIREGMLGTAPATPMFPTGAANIWGLLLAFQVIPQRTEEISQRAMLEVTIQKLNLALVFPIAADTGRRSPGGGGVRYPGKPGPL